MTNKICATPQECIDAFLNNIHTADKGGIQADLAFRDALVSLVGLYDCLGENFADFKGSSQMQQFRAKSSAELVMFEQKLRAYSTITLFMAEEAAEDEWYQLCMRRSIIQILMDDYAGTPVAEFIDIDDVSDLDHELRRVGLEQGPILEKHIPAGLSESHWWWRYPGKSIYPQVNS